MVAPASDEKSTMIMVYTSNMLVRGEVITRQAVRVNTWLRTQGVPEYIRIFKPTVLLFGSNIVKPLNYKEIYVPVAVVIGFHTMVQGSDPLDYDESETNRMMVPITCGVGHFLMKGLTRISTKAELSTSIELSHSAWMSLYNVDVSSPSMPQMQPIHVPMALLNPKQISLAVEG